LSLRGELRGKYLFIQILAAGGVWSKAETYETAKPNTMFGV
jgi:hypothetical protein